MFEIGVRIWRRVETERFLVSSDRGGHALTRVSIAVDHAQALGANALISLRYDATEIMSGVSEVLCYGTAVRVVRDSTFNREGGEGG